MPSTNTMTATTAGVLTTLVLEITMLVWSGSGTVGDVLDVQDSGGRSVWKAAAPAAQYNLSFSPNSRINGINVVTINSGQLTVHYR